MSDPASLAGFLPDAHPVDGYGAGGFRFGGMSHRGSLIVVPAGVYAWAARVPADITAESLERVFVSPRGSVELLLLGTGIDLVPVPAALRRALKSLGIGVEPMATGAAARTFNILLGERRRVATALLAVD